MTQAPDKPTEQTSAGNEHRRRPGGAVEAHAGQHAVAMARAHGVDVMFTLSGAHVFPMYDGAVTAEPPMRILDVRHEQTAAFAAEAIGKLTRRPGLAVLTAGPGVTNGVSAIAQAQFSGSPLVVVGGRAPANRWGSGSLQELDHPPILASVSKSARTIHTAGEVADGLHEAFTLAGTSHRGPVFVDVPMDEFFATATSPRPEVGPRSPSSRTGTPSPRSPSCSGRPSARCWCSAPTCGPTAPRRPRSASSRRPGCRSSPTGWAAASSPAVTRCSSPRPAAPRSGAADLVVVAGTPLDFRLGYGVFGGQGRRRPARASCTSRTPPARSPSTPTSRARRPATSPWCSTACATRSPGWYDAPTGRPG